MLSTEDGLALKAAKVRDYMGIAFIERNVLSVRKGTRHISGFLVPCFAGQSQLSAIGPKAHQSLQRL
jgi:hypothetical protein